MDVRDGFVWLQFPDSGGRQQFPPDSVPGWKARGWVECDPPVEPNRLKDPIVEEPQPERTPAPPFDVPSPVGLPDDDSDDFIADQPSTGDSTEEG